VIRYAALERMCSCYGGYHYIGIEKAGVSLALAITATIKTARVSQRVLNLTGSPVTGLLSQRVVLRIPRKYDLVDDRVSRFRY
jgi:hypothetical protein